MSAKYFCDVCGEKMAKTDHDRVRRILGDVMIEVMVRYKNTWNAGHVCHKCVGVVAVKGKPAAKNDSWIDDHNANRNAA